MIFIVHVKLVHVYGEIKNRWAQGHLLGVACLVAATITATISAGGLCAGAFLLWPVHAATTAGAAALLLRHCSRVEKAGYMYGGGVVAAATCCAGCCGAAAAATCWPCGR